MLRAACYDPGMSDNVKPSPLKRVGREMVELSTWKKALLALFLCIAAVGGGMWVHGQMNTFEEVETVQKTVERPRDAARDGPRLSVDGATGPSASMFDSSSSTGDRADDEDGGTVTETVEEDVLVTKLPWTGRLGTWMVRLGISFALGLVVGVFFRTFLKTMAVISAVAIAAIVGLSYFEMLPIDFTTMRTNYDNASEWVGGRAGEIKEMAMAFLPSATAGGFGFFVGFLRR